MDDLSGALVQGPVVAQEAAKQDDARCTLQGTSENVKFVFGVAPPVPR